ncbi:hypothetical protein L1887_23203 [Cichorium endivia]|nr:hypothetical protein L1887_23203 [Cichorium endivia]
MELYPIYKQRNIGNVFGKFVVFVIMLFWYSDTFLIYLWNDAKSCCVAPHCLFLSHALEQCIYNAHFDLLFLSCSYSKAPDNFYSSRSIYISFMMALDIIVAIVKE